MGTWLFVILSTVLLTIAHAEEEEVLNSRDKKLISVFQVVKFKNDVCKGNNARNGTCFTSAECSNIGGSSSGSCADGFGVCCVVTLTKGGTSASVNNSYIVQTVFTTGSSKYEICPCSDDICRIKFDFTTFTLTGPVTGIGNIIAGGGTITAIGASMGDCTVDTFQILASDGRATPVICGTNANQHMFIDVSDKGCAHVDLGIGLTSTTTRSLDIKIIQYACGNDDVAGPQGCLQYFPNSSGKIRTFNFPDQTPGAAVGAGVVHLSNQHYKACVRRATASNYICYAPCTSSNGGGGTAGSATTAMNSFGLSGGGSAIISASNLGSYCSTDYIYIAYGQYVAGEMASGTADYTSTPINRLSRFCGNAISTTEDTGGATVSISVCSFTTPFVVGVTTDEDEFCTANTSKNTCEAVGTITNPHGNAILGFSLCYVQG
jgi:hypothetical protein